MKAMTISAARGPKATISRVSRVSSTPMASESGPVRRLGSQSFRPSLLTPRNRQTSGAYGASKGTIRHSAARDRSDGENGAHGESAQRPQVGGCPYAPAEDRLGLDHRRA